MNQSVYNNSNGILPASLSPAFLRGSNMLDSYRNDYSDAKPTLVIYHAFTGFRVVAPFDIFTSMDQFKRYISDLLHISVERLFLLTPFGIKLKFAMILNEQITEVYAFDRKFFNPAIVKETNIAKRDIMIKELVDSISKVEHLEMIKPRDAPFNSLSNSSNSSMVEFIDKISDMIQDVTDIEEIHLNSSDVDFGSLRSFLNLFKRNSGWASALMSDMHSTLYDDMYRHDYQVVENILNALNALIQYINNLLSNLEKELNTFTEIFSNLEKNTLSHTWQEAYDLLRGISFSYSDNNTAESREIIFSELVDYPTIEKAAMNSKLCATKIQKNLKKVKSSIAGEITSLRDNVYKDYDILKRLYMNKDWETEEADNLTKEHELFDELAINVSNLQRDYDNLPSFEELITTSNQMSTFLSKDAIAKIVNLIKLYNKHKTNEVPRIKSLSDSIYKIEKQFFDMRTGLQEKIANSTIIIVINIQLMIRTTSNVLNMDILTNIEDMQKSELQLTIVNDLPLIFGIWAIAALSNKKYGVSLEKLSRKTNEVLKMMNFVEQNSRAKWLNEFISGAGIEKVDLQFLNERQLKSKFISEGLFNFRLVNQKGVGNEQQGNETTQLVAPKRYNSETVGYLSPFNKLIHRSFTNKSKSEKTIPTVASLEKTKTSYFDGLMVSITIGDIAQYMKTLELVGYDHTFLSQLSTFMNNIGIFLAPEKTNKEIVVKSGNVEDLGSFDMNDKHYLKIFKDFIKNFETKDIHIEVETVNNKFNEANKRSKMEDESLKNDNVTSYERGLVKAYEERIQKLENLLHEKKYGMFNTKWSRFHPENLKFLNEDDMENNFDNEEEIDNTGYLLGRRTIKLPPSHYFERIKTLEIENKKLIDELGELKKNEEYGLILQLQTKLNDQENEVARLNILLEEETHASERKQTEIDALREEVASLRKENNGLKVKNLKLSNDICDLSSMNKDLLENMENKEAEYLNENKLNQKEKNEMNLRIEELIEITHQYEQLSFQIKETDNYVDELISVLMFMSGKLKEMSGKIFANLGTVCLILEIMGLMLVRKGSDLNICRVKGLRNKKKQILMGGHGEVRISNEENIDINGDNDRDVQIEDEKLLYEVIASGVVDEVRKYVDWIPDFNMEELHGLLAEKDTTQESGFTSTKLKGVSETIECLKGSEHKLKYIIDTIPKEILDLKYQEFKENVSVDKGVVLRKIHKRFEDVETLARKLQREKVQLRGEIKNLTKQLSQRLVLRDFSVGDLVLFLPTLALDEQNNSIASNKQHSSVGQPWAVFNTGSPNYYLKPETVEQMCQSGDREWMVGRILSLEKHVVTCTNKDSSMENPFNLAVGSQWWWVQSERE